MNWPFRLRHKPEDAPAVQQASEKRDELFVDLDDAIREVDRVQMRVIAEYESAEQRRLERRRK